VNLKDPLIAAVLAFLLPGMGHFYQRRIFKGVLYAVCILGTFFTGLKIGHGQVVYFHWKQSENRTYAYLCQVCVGLPALPALVQARRARDSYEPNFVPHAFSSEFEGTLSNYGDNATIGTVKGTIRLGPEKPDNPKWWVGSLTGTLTTDEGSKKIEGNIQQRGNGLIEAEVAPWRERRIKCQFVPTGDRQAKEVFRLDGFILRPLYNYYEAPLQDGRPNDFAGEPSDLDRAHRELGGRFELGIVYTMIAGLLNILAIYDAYEGPAYEDEEDDGDSEKPPTGPPTAPA
jgi:hypothetical protein